MISVNRIVMVDARNTWNAFFLPFVCCSLLHMVYQHPQCYVVGQLLLQSVQLPLPWFSYCLLRHDNDLELVILAALTITIPNIIRTAVFTFHFVQQFLLYCCNFPVEKKRNCFNSAQVDNSEQCYGRIFTEIRN